MSALVVTGVAICALVLWFVLSDGSPWQIAFRNTSASAEDTVLPPSAVATSVATIIAGAAPLPRPLAPGAAATATKAPEERPAAAGASSLTTPTSDPEATLLASPAPSPTVALPSPHAAAPAPTATPDPAEELLRRVAAAENRLRTGQFDLAIAYAGKTRSTAQVRFDRGDAGEAPRLSITTTYEGARGATMAERITIGEQSWQRQQGGAWVALPAQESVWGELQAFLPHAEGITSARVVSDGDAISLQWYEANQGADVTLLIDPATGTPHEMRQVNRASGDVLTVIYRSWNTPVEIQPPAGD
jgi:hypothetical protein